MGGKNCCHEQISVENTEKDRSQVISSPVGGSRIARNYKSLENIGEKRIARTYKSLTNIGEKRIARPSIRVKLILEEARRN